MNEHLTRVVEYHNRTKHHPNRYARALGFMDWSTQPDPFRHFEGAPRIALEHPPIDEQILYDSLFCPGAIRPSPLSVSSISRLFYDSMAISAWKQAPGTAPWSLRINPSSGCLHPTESYLLAGAIDGLSDRPALYHYSPCYHALERRIGFPADLWKNMAAQLPANAVLVALSSIYWRESWKYGERAFRYCHHDVGHAIGAIAFSAAVLGWQTQLNDAVSDARLARLLGIHQQQGVEAEHPDCLLTLNPRERASSDRLADTLEIPAAIIEQLSDAEFAGRPNRLSAEHHLWPVIDDVSLATRHAGRTKSVVTDRFVYPADRADSVVQDRELAAQAMIRQRRSAVAMDGHTTIDRKFFYRMLRRTMPGTTPFDLFPWPPRVSLALMSHRVDGIDAGLYLLVRDPHHLNELRTALSPDFVWQDPPDCPEDLPLFLLRAADYRETAKLVSCHQDIAADGAFSLGMLAQFETALHQHGPSFYPRLYWETGLIGQLLYLEAEAAGIRATGIGCFFDDVMHEVLGIRGHSWQSLYHFTVGGERNDMRIQTIPPYHHLPKR